MYRPSLVHTQAQAAGLACTQSPGMVLQAPHFARSLEWLLFTALDSSSGSHAPPPKLAARPVTSTALGQDPGQPPKAAPASSQEAPRSKGAAGPLLQAAADLVRRFPEVCPVPEAASPCRCRTALSGWPCSSLAGELQGQPAGWAGVLCVIVQLCSLAGQHACIVSGSAPSPRDLQGLQLQARHGPPTCSHLLSTGTRLPSLAKRASLAC